MVKIENLYSEIWTKMPSITTSSQCCTRGLRKYKKIRKLNNKRKIERKERKLLFTGDLIIQIENLRDN